MNAQEIERLMDPGRIPFVPRTKLRPLRLGNDILVRTRLLDRLDCTQTLALIIAPAGYGKTTLVSTWLAQRGHPYAWLSLEDDDNAPAALLAGLVAAVRSLFPTFGADLFTLLHDPAGELTPALLLPPLLNALDRLERDFVLVLDDYHHLANPAIHQLIWGLLTFPPRPLRLVLTARHDPPIPPRLRSQGTVTYIRTREMSFTAAETLEFLSQFAARPLAAPAVTILNEQAEGWAVPLRLMAMLLSQRPDIPSLDEALHQCERSLLDYLDAEVIGHFPSAVQTFLARTSVLQRLHASLCDAVVGEELPDAAGAKVLPMLVEAGIFVEPLDGDGEWFRYHELFRTLLQRRLRTTHDPQAVEAMNQRAQTWFQTHGPPEDARSCARFCSDTPWAIPPQPSRWVEQATSPSAQFAAALTTRPGQLPSGHDCNVRELVTFREMDVLLLLNKRLTNKEIARVLGISPDTVRQHAVNIYRKLGVENRRQAIVRASALGVFAHEHQ